MSLLLYLAVLLVSISSVLFGLGWLSTPAPHYQTPAVQVASHAPAKSAAAKSAEPAAPGRPVVANAPAAGKAASAAPPVMAENAAGADSADGAPQAQAAAPPGCDVQACTLAYRSFRASDCTYQPYVGPRRLCTKGRRPGETQAKAAPAPSGIDAQARAAASCNIAACEAAYRSFNPSDCTYQPYDGPRRICNK